MKMVGSSRLCKISQLLVVVMILATACASLPTPTPASPAIAPLSTVTPAAATSDKQVLAQAPVDAKPKFIEFYASWCVPCVRMKPIVSRLRDEYGNRVDFKIYDVAGSQAEMRLYKYVGQPQYNLVDRRGEILFIRNGTQNYESLKADLESVLAKQ